MTENSTCHLRAARCGRLASTARPHTGGLLRRIATLLSTLPLLATPAWAVQAHGGAEGLVAHQLGHLLFTAGMGYLLYRLAIARTRGPGWLEFRLFLWLLIAWNVVTFIGHGMHEYVDAAKYVREGAQIVAYRVDGPWDALFYATRLDHLVLVPAFIALILALLKWRGES